MIYIRYADIPFYYKEIIYDWNYSAASNKKLNNNKGWVELLWDKKSVINIEENIENLYGLQTNLFSFQKEVEIHNHLNTIIVIISALVCFYLFYIAVNTFTYKHENKRIKQLIRINVIFLIIIISLYNTEIITTILYKMNFIYTDNVYLTNQSKSNTNNNILIGILLFIYYEMKQIKETKNTISKHYLYILYIIINVMDENIIIGIEYIYLIIYTEILIIIISLLKNRRTDG